MLQSVTISYHNEPNRLLTMRTFFFVITLVLGMGFVSHAQDKNQANKTTIIEKGVIQGVIATNFKSSPVLITSFKLHRAKGVESAGIYMYKNTKIKRALAFMAQSDRPKLA